jgi:hypothetical protein
MRCRSRTREGVDLFHSGKGLGHLRRHNRDRIGRSMGRRKQEQFLFRRVRRAGGAPRVREHAVLSGACRRARAFHGGSRQCLLLQCASHLRRRSQAVLFFRRGRQRPGQVSDCLLPVEHFKSQEVIVWEQHGLSGNGLCGDGHPCPSGERSSPPYRHLLSACGKQPSPAPHDPSASLRAGSQECPSHTMGAIYGTVAASA